MQPAASFAVPHSAARALFAQGCTHDTHYLNHKGDLYTALITGGNRLLMLKNGRVVAQSGPLFDLATPQRNCEAQNTVSDRNAFHKNDSIAASASAWKTPCVYVVSICHFIDNVLRIAVATTTGIFIFEFDDAGLLWQDTRPSSFWRAADRDGEDGALGSGSLPTVATGSAVSPTNRYPAVHGRSHLLQLPTGSPLGGLRSTPAASAVDSSSPPSSASLARAEAGLEDSGMAGRLRWRRVAFSLGASPPCPATTSTTTAVRFNSTSSLPYRGPALSTFSNSAEGTVATAVVGGDAGGKPVLIAPVRVAAPARPSAVRAMDFVSEGALCVVLETETVLIMLGNSNSTAAQSSSTCGTGGATAALRVPDRVVWRSLGAYRSLAVCRVNHHIALALGHSSMVVFPSRVLTADGQDSAAGLPGDGDGGRVGTAFSTATSSFFMTNSASGDGAAKFMPVAMPSAMRGMLSDSRSSSVVPTPAFSPAIHPMPVPALPGGVFPQLPSLSQDGKANPGAPPLQPYITLAEQGLTASVGIYHITDMRWHRVSSHTLLCVTCSHPREEAAYMMLYTVQSLSTTRRFTNVMEERADGGWSLCRGGYDGDGVMDGSVTTTSAAGKALENFVQLVPAGVIDLTYTFTSPSTGPNPPTDNTATSTPCKPQLQTASATPEQTARSVSSTAATTTWGGAPPPPVAEMHTSLVPNFSRSAEANSMGNRMEFLHVEGDGTVRTSSYSFGRQKHASFAKQRAVGLACTELLQSLLHLYGSLVRVTVLPSWRSRPIELGHHTGKQPQAVEVLLSASRRYRLVLRFTMGVVMSVMVDLSAAVYRVECYLALGCASLRSLRAIFPIPELKSESHAAVKMAQAAIGTTTMLLVGLLDFPTPSSPPAGKPQQLLMASPSFLEEGEVDVWRHIQSPSKAFRFSSSSVAAAANTAPSHPLLPPSSIASTTTPARTVWGVVLLQVEPSGLQARVLTIAPLSEVKVAGVTDTVMAELQTTKEAAADNTGHTVSAGVETAAVSEADVSDYMKKKCPEKLKFMPALLKATQQDAGKLLTQLMAKYGPLEKIADAVQDTRETTELGNNAQVAAATSSASSAAPSNSVTSAGSITLPSPSVLLTGCVTEDGEVVLLLTCPNDHSGGNADQAGKSAAPAAIVRIRAPCLAAFAPVQKLVAAGNAQVPFVPVAAEYIAIPAALRQRWWPRGSMVTPFPSSLSTPSAEAHDVYAAYQLCCRLSARLQGTKTVQCEVMNSSVDATTISRPYVRVYCPLAPEGKEAGASLAALQYLPLPEGARAAAGSSSGATPMLVEEVKGVLQVNNDIVVGVLYRDSSFVARGAAAAKPSSLSVDAPNTQTVGILHLYGCPAVQSLAATATSGPTQASSAKTAADKSSDNRAGSDTTLPPSAFMLEATLTGVEAFYFSASGEVVVLRRTATADTTQATQGRSTRKAVGNLTGSAASQGLRFERWLRCFPGGSGIDTSQNDSRRDAVAALPDDFTNGYYYLQDPTWCPPCGPATNFGTGEPAATVTAVTMMEVAGAWEANVMGRSSAAKHADRRTATRPILYALADNSFIHLRQAPLRSSSDDLEQRPIDLTRNYKSNRTSSYHSNGEQGESTAHAGLPQYHPDAVMQLIGMARWSILAKVLTLVLRSAKAALSMTTMTTTSTTAEPLKFLFSQPPDELAQRLCTSAVARSFRDRPQVVQYDNALYRVTPPRLSTAALRDDIETSTSTTAGEDALSAVTSTVPHRLYDLTATCGSLFAELTEVLPQVTLTGLSSQEQLSLLCILQALRDTLPLSRSVDEAAARYLFFTRFMSLGRRLRLPNIDISAAAIPGVPINSVLYFEVGRTATRTVSTAAYLWAAMSDSQSTLMSLLFDKASAMYLDGSAGAVGTTNLGAGEITWEQVEQSGAAFWLRSAADLRTMADRVARHQYQRTKDLTACALMYCTAHKVGTLAALAKAQNNPRLYAFFSRDFARDEHHRAAASANAYAAISKNMPQYGAAFFLLAGDVQSAVQVLLQRCHDPFLALFVLRAAGEGANEVPGPSAVTPGNSTKNCNDTLTTETPGNVSAVDATVTGPQKSNEKRPETLLQWYRRQRTLEVHTCGTLDIWEAACLSWMDVTPQTTPEVAVQRRIEALQRIAAHPTAHPEALCALRYARDGVAALAYRGDRFLSPAREVVCLLRLGRYCLAHRLNLNAYLHYRDAEGLLCGLRAKATRQKGLTMGTKTAVGVSFGQGLRGGTAPRPPLPPKMTADFSTGTLTFRGFDSDDEDDSIYNRTSGNASISMPQEESATAEAEEEEDEEPFVLNDEAAATVQTEMQYAYRRSGVVYGSESDVPITTPSSSSSSTSYEDVLRRMLLCFTSASSFMCTSSVTVVDGADAACGASFTAASTAASPHGGSPELFKDLLTQLLRRLISDMPGGRPEATETTVSFIPILDPLGDGALSKVEAEESLPLPEPSTTTASAAGTSSMPNGSTSVSPTRSTLANQPVHNCSVRESMKCAAEGWDSLCIPLLHLLLGKIALQEANYLVLLSLQRIPISTEGVLEAADQAGLLHDVFERAVRSAAASSPPADAPDITKAQLSLSTGELSPLYLPLVAFFMLLGRYVVRYYKEALAAEEERQGEVVLCDGTNGLKGSNTTADGIGEEEMVKGGDDSVHRSMFEALMAAAAAAEKLQSQSQSGTSFPGVRDGRDRLGGDPFAGNDDDGSSDAIDSADDEGFLGSGGTNLSSTITEAAQVSFLLSCCQSQLQLRLLEHLRHLARTELQAAVHTPTTQRALDAGVLYSDPLSPAAQAMLLQRRILLSTMLLDVTTQWGALAEETMLQLYTALPRYAPGPLTDPNGVFLEVRLDVLCMRTVLVALLAGPQGVTEAEALAEKTESAEGYVGDPVSSEGQEEIVSQSQRSRSGSPESSNSTSQAASTTTWLEENTLMLLELCTTQLELFWTFPSLALTQCRQLATPTRAVLRLLHKSTASHSTARKLLDHTLRPVKETFSSAALSHRSHSAPLTSHSSLGSPVSRNATTFPAEKIGSSSSASTRRAEDEAREMYCPALSFLQLSWMRRHHNHALLRWLLLDIALDAGRESKQRLLQTDRLILIQHSHPVTGVQFDLSSCDSVVCTTEGGTTVGHGFRELLAGDNEEALWSQSTERNLATAAFTLGLTAQQERLQLAASHNEGEHTPEVVAALATRAVLESRPRCAVAANAMPASHPHLPFFLTRHRDGHLDLYPFASQECIASFCCALRHGQSNTIGGGSAHASASPNTWTTWNVGPSSNSALSLVSAAAATAHPSSVLGSVQRMERHAVTPVTFSPNGYIIAAGLSDGAVAGWRFAAAAVENAPAFVFPKLFAPYGIRACTFCGYRSSLVAVVGLTWEPHPHPRARLHGGSMPPPAPGTTASASVASVRPTAFASSVAMSSMVSTTVPGARTTEAGELVGELLILDTMLDSGAVTARCALPWMPSYAVYLTPLRAVLMVSLDGLMATYSVPTGRLAMIETVGVTSVLTTLLGASLEERSGATRKTTGAAASAAAGGGVDGNAVHITCVAKSAYDPLVALGTSKGLVLVLHLRHISAAMREADRRVCEDGEDVFVYYPPAAGSKTNSPDGAVGKRKPATTVSTPASATSRAAADVLPPVMGTEFMKRLSQTSVLAEATCVQVAPQMQSRSAVEDVVFSPSMLLAGLRDGRVMAAAVIAQALRTRLTAGSSVLVDLLEPVENRT